MLKPGTVDAHLLAYRTLQAAAGCKYLYKGQAADAVKESARKAGVTDPTVIDDATKLVLDGLATMFSMRR